MKKPIWSPWFIRKYFSALIVNPFTANNGSSRFYFGLFADQITDIGKKGMLMYGLKIKSNFQPLEVVDRGSDPQHLVVENLTKLTQRDKG